MVAPHDFLLDRYSCDVTSQPPVGSLLGSFDDAVRSNVELPRLTTHSRGSGLRSFSQPRMDLMFQHITRSAYPP